MSNLKMTGGEGGGGSKSHEKRPGNLGMNPYTLFVLVNVYLAFKITILRSPFCSLKMFYLPNGLLILF